MNLNGMNTNGLGLVGLPSRRGAPMNPEHIVLTEVADMLERSIALVNAACDASTTPSRDRLALNLVSRDLAKAFKGILPLAPSEDREDDTGEKEGVAVHDYFATLTAEYAAKLGCDPVLLEEMSEIAGLYVWNTIFDGLRQPLTDREILDKIFAMNSQKLPRRFALAFALTIFKIYRDYDPDPLATTKEREAGLRWFAAWIEKWHDTLKTESGATRAYGYLVEHFHPLVPAPPPPNDGDGESDDAA
jgi:hypothetical protein